MRDEALWREIAMGGHGVSELKSRILSAARLQLQLTDTDAETALADAARRVTYLAHVADQPLALPPMLHRLWTQAARQGSHQDFVQRVRPLGFRDSAGYRQTIDLYASEFGAPPPASQIWPPFRIVQMMRILWWVFCAGCALMVLGIGLDVIRGKEILVWFGVAVTGFAFIAILLVGRRLGWLPG